MSCLSSNQVMRVVVVVRGARTDGLCGIISPLAACPLMSTQRYLCAYMLLDPYFTLTSLLIKSEWDKGEQTKSKSHSSNLMTCSSCREM